MKKTKKMLEEELEKTKKALLMATLATVCELCPVERACKKKEGDFSAQSCAETFLNETPLLSRQ